MHVTNRPSGPSIPFVIPDYGSRSGNITAAIAMIVSIALSAYKVLFANTTRFDKLVTISGTALCVATVLYKSYVQGSAEQALSSCVRFNETSAQHLKYVRDPYTALKYLDMESVRLHASSTSSIEFKDHEEWFLFLKHINYGKDASRESRLILFTKVVESLVLVEEKGQFYPVDPEERSLWLQTLFNKSFDPTDAGFLKGMVSLLRTQNETNMINLENFQSIVADVAEDSDKSDSYFAKFVADMNASEA